MSKQRSQRSPEDANYWINEAEERLDHARGYVSGKNARILCERRTTRLSSPSRP